MDILKANRNIDLLYPPLAQKALKGIKAANDAGFQIKIFETWRSPQRQEFLYAKGRFGSDEDRVTSARAWESWHQYGLAFDVAYWENDKWHWDKSFEGLTKFFVPLGLKWGGKNDSPHYQLTPKGIGTAFAKDLIQSSGLQALWTMIDP